MHCSISKTFQSLHYTKHQPCLLTDGRPCVQAFEKLCRDEFSVSPPYSELIIVPRSVLDGLVTALHIRLDHPSKHQLMLVMKRHFYALDLAKAVDSACVSSHVCASLQKFPDRLIRKNS